MKSDESRKKKANTKKENNETGSLAAYASPPDGPLCSREYPTKVPTIRSDFERDRDRILHSKAFRRMAHKSQVFIYYYGDHHRSRLTHTLEVESIACSIAGVLGLNLHLSSAIALAHDLGATPFGKAGENILNKIMKKNSLQGFYHNHQGIRIVERLEKQYPDYRGLNLTLAIKEGILKHGEVDKQFARLHSKHLRDFLEKTDSNIPSTLEAQAVKISDDIAQTYHYIEDGLRYNLIPVDTILQSKLWQETTFFLQNAYNIDFSEFLSDSIYKDDEDIKKLSICRFLIKFLVTGVIQNAEKKIKKNGKKVIKPGKITTSIVNFNEKLNKIVNNFYTRVIDPYIFKKNALILISRKCENIVENVFNEYRKHPELLPRGTLDLYRKSEESDGNIELRVLADHISGMSDRYAIKIYRDLFDISQMPFPVPIE